MKPNLTTVGRVSALLRILGYLLGPIMTPARAQDDLSVTTTEPTVETIEPEITQEPQIEANPTIVPTIEVTIEPTQTQIPVIPAEVVLFSADAIYRAPIAVDDEITLESGGIQLLVMSNDGDPDGDRRVHACNHQWRHRFL